MLTVHVLARPHLLGALMSFVNSQPDTAVGFRGSNLREVLTWPVSPDDVLVCEDRLIAEVPGLVADLSGIACVRVLVGTLGDAACARRAVALGALNIVDETRLLQELPEVIRDLIKPEPSPSDPLVLSVYSAKGGVGKSTIALNLAWALALQSERKVALVDCDPLGDIGAMIQDKPGASVADVMQALNNGLSEDKALQMLHHMKGIGLTVAPAPADPHQAEACDAPAMQQFIDLVRRHHDYVVLDLATGLSDVNLTAMDASMRILVLAAPERVTLKSVGRALTVLHRFYPDKLRVLLNRADSDTGLDVADVQEQLGRMVSDVLPSGGSGPVRAANRGRPLVLNEPKNPLAKALTSMAVELVGAREGTHRRPRRWLGR